jgi:uncharacterized protein YdiU (UPF0061 family)
MPDNQMPTMHITFDNSYARDLPGFYEACRPATVRAPVLLFVNHGLAEELGLGLAGQDDVALAAMFSGNALPEGAQPIAQAYAGHQFGHFSPHLGDGRALLIGEVIDRYSRRRDIALKGSGRTPFSRRGDGKAAVGPMLREVLIGEAMHALGIPTTRALAVVSSGEPVFRERALPGAILTRVAASHLRVGTFQYFAAHGTPEQMRQLADYAIARHNPELVGTTDRYRGFLRVVAERQAALVAQWMHVGFIHGVMNTDNMGIPGETIDYGPCAFMEAFDPRAVFSSIDEWGRYAYEEQSGIARWNLSRLAEALLPLIEAHEGRGPFLWLPRSSTPSQGATSTIGWLGCVPSWGCTGRWPMATVWTPPWAKAGWICCTLSRSTSPWPGAGWQMRRKATKRRCGPCSSGSRGWTAGCNAGASDAPPKMPSWRTMGRPPPAPSGCAGSIPG